MNKKLQRQIKVYAGVAGAILIADKSGAQVIYTDVIPDDSTFAFSGQVDMDNDGSAEIFNSINASTFIAGYAGPFYVCEDIWATAPNAQLFRLTYGSACCNVGGNLKDLKNFNYSSVIGPALPPQTVMDHLGRFFNLWSSSDNGTILSFCYDGNFINGWGGKYLGIKFGINGMDHYGWIRVKAIKFHNWPMLILKDYAYESTPNAPILAGRKSSIAGIQDLYASSIKIDAENKKVRIETQGQYQKQISVFNLLGELMNAVNENKTLVEISLEKTGIYFVEVKSDKGIFRKKIYIY